MLQDRSVCLYRLGGYVPLHSLDEEPKLAIQVAPEYNNVTKVRYYW